MKIDLYCLAQKYSPKNIFVSDVSLIAIFAEVTEDCIIDRHLHVIDASLICIGAYSTFDSHSTLSI